MMKLLAGTFVLLIGQTLCATSLQAESHDRPNIVLIMADDMGFSDLGCYGSQIDTPNLDALASQGLRLIDFHNNAKCSETRATLLTGLWHQQSKNLKKSTNITLAEALGQSGYTTLMSGKWHLAGNPRDRGFDRYFGFLSGAINFYTGRDWGSDDNLMRLDREEFKAGEGFYSTDAFTDYAIDFLTEARKSDQPYFLYLAHNAPHFPLQAPAEEIAKYRDKFDHGWDKMRSDRLTKMKKMGIVPPQWKPSDRDDRVEPWEKLSDAQKSFLLPMMEVYAAMIDRLDQNIGRLVENIRSAGELENTLIVFISDNGACPYQRMKTPDTPIGGADSGVAYDARWASVCNTPLRLYKQYAHHGGTLTPAIVHWPAKIKNGGSISKATGHIVDLMPTFLEAGGSQYPTEHHGEAIEPMEGQSMLNAWTQDQQDKRTKPIYWEFSGNRAVRLGDWKLAAERSTDWKLYDLRTDFCETSDVAGEHPEQVAKMAKLYDQWASRVGARTNRKSKSMKPSGQSQLFDLPATK